MSEDLHEILRVLRHGFGDPDYVDTPSSLALLIKESGRIASALEALVKLAEKETT